MKIASLIREKDSMIFIGNYMEVYIPKIYFDDLEVAYFNGHKIDTLGIFFFKIFSDPDNKDKFVQHVMKLPASVTMCPSSVDDIEIADDDTSDEATSYKVLKFYKNDIFIENVYILRSSGNVINFYNILTSGKFPRMIPYDELIKVLIDNLLINNINLNAPSTTHEIIISEICRDKNCMYDPFRFKVNKSDKVGMLDYVPINIKNIARFNSTFSAVTFEDMDYSLTTSVNKLRQNKVEKETPIEKTIKF